MFIMDFLKSNAPFWKKENGKAESKWVQARDVDAKALQRWSV
jgi:molybdopterin synthase catalytic subunit